MGGAAFALRFRPRRSRGDDAGLQRGRGPVTTVLNALDRQAEVPRVLDRIGHPLTPRLEDGAQAMSGLLRLRGSVLCLVQSGKRLGPIRRIGPDNLLTGRV